MPAQFFGWLHLVWWPSPGTPPKWVEKLLSTGPTPEQPPAKDPSNQAGDCSGGTSSDAEPLEERVPEVEDLPEEFTCMFSELQCSNDPSSRHTRAQAGPSLIQIRTRNVVSPAWVMTLGSSFKRGLGGVTVRT